MKRNIVAGNWKMNGTKAEIKVLVKGILSGLSEFKQPFNLDVIVFPSFVYLDTVKEQVTNSPIFFGAQTLSEQEKGAYTGEISAQMLRDMGCTYVLVGHSERRYVYKESNQLIADKFDIAIKHNLIPVLCFGETHAQRESNQTETIVLEQIKAVIDKIGIEPFKHCVLAYEPVWAIGTGLTATPEQAQSVHGLIRNYIAEQNKEIAENLTILYGGSVKPHNAKALFDMPDIDGGLVGGASLVAEKFVSIIKAFAQ